MISEIDGRRYEILIGTDLSNDRVFVELSDPGTLAFLATVFRSETTGRLTVDVHEQDVPLEALSYFLHVAEKELSVERWPLG